MQQISAFWFSVAFYLISLINGLVGTQTWPYCNNFAEAQGYPWGCKTSPTDVCMVQNEECKTLLCEGVDKKQFRLCGAACESTPHQFLIELGNGLNCWCSRAEQKICSGTTQLAEITQQLPHNSLLLFQSIVFNRKIEGRTWVAAMKIPESLLLPVFCYGKSDCTSVPGPSLCNVGKCPGNMCSYENNCYYVAEYRGNAVASCGKLGKPAAIESRNERQYIFFFLHDAWIANVESPIIATAGRVTAKTTKIIWDNWNIDVSEEVVGDLVINEEDFDQVLYLTPDKSFLMSWGVQDISSPITAVLCKMRLGDTEEICDTTITTTEFVDGISKSTSTTSIPFKVTTDASNDDTTTANTQTTTVQPSTITYTTGDPNEPTPGTLTTQSTQSTSTTAIGSNPNSTTESTTEPSTEETTDSSTELSTEETTENPTSDQPLCFLVKCIKTDQYGEEWKCCDKTECTRNCPLEANGSAVWRCNSTQFTTTWPDYENCSSLWVANLTIMIEEEKVSSLELIMDLDQFMKDSSIFGHEINISLQFLTDALNLLKKEQISVEIPLATEVHQRKFLSEMALGVIDKLLALEKPWEQLQQWQKVKIGNIMQRVTEEFGFSITEKALEMHEEYNMSCEWSKTHMEAQYHQIKKRDQSSLVRFPMVPNPLKSSIIIQKIPSVVNSDQEIKEVTAVGTLIPMDSAEMLFPGSITSLQSKKKKLNAGMISMSLSGQKREAIHKLDSDDAVIITFKHDRQAKGPAYANIRHELYPGEQPTAIKDTAVCVFWNRLKETNGQWDTEGCYLVNSSHWHTICQCNHLSSFALLMDVHNYIAKDEIMEIVSIVFSSLSVISLALTLFVLHGLKGIQGERNSIGKHLCLCLLTGHLMALTVLDRSYFQLPQEMCVGVAVALHYVFLAAFMWMAVEGHHLYRLVVRVFDSGRDLSRIYLCLGYGTPVVVVAITCIVTASLNDTGYANDELCWLSSPTYIWAFMGPVLFLTLLNLVVLVLAMRVAVTAANQQKKNFMERVKSWIRGWFSLTALLGVTWIFGFFYIQWDHNFAYAFITLNGCQGIFIFLTRVVFNEQVKSALRRGAKQRAMMKRFYSLAWKGRGSGSPSSWFFGSSSSSSQLDLTSSASTSYWANTSSRRRSSANHSCNDGYSDAPTEIQGTSNLQNNLNYAASQPENAKTSMPWHKRKNAKEEENIESAAIQSNNWSNTDVQQMWNNIREADTLSEIPEEDYEDDGYEKKDNASRKTSYYKY